MIFPHEHSQDPARIHGAEQMWAEASAHLDRIIDQLRTMEPEMYAATENTDISVLYDFLKGYIQEAELRGGDAARKTTLLMCAAAITRLVRASRTDTNNPLAQLNWEMNNDDDH